MDRTGTRRVILPIALASIAPVATITSCAIPSFPMMLSAGCTADGVYVKNLNSFYWKNVKVQLNSSLISTGFTSASISLLPAGESLTIPFDEIYSSDGSRFDRAQQSCLSVGVMADNQSGRMGVHIFKNESGAPVEGILTSANLETR